MSLQLYTEGKRTILHGNVDDAHWHTIVRMGPDLFVVTEMSDGDDKFYYTVFEYTKESFEKEFNLQYGSPMQYLSREKYLKFLAQ